MVKKTLKLINHGSNVSDMMLVVSVLGQKLNKNTLKWSLKLSDVKKWTKYLFGIWLNYASIEKHWNVIDTMYPKYYKITVSMWLMCQLFEKSIKTMFKAN